MSETIVKSLSLSQLNKLESFVGKAKKLGINFAVCNTEGELVLLCQGSKFSSNQERLIEYSREALKQDGDICRFGEGNLVLAAALKFNNEAIGVALFDLDESLVQTGNKYLEEILALFADNFQIAAKAEEQIEIVSTELTQVYEELALLHKLSMNMKVSEPDAKYLQLACDSLTNIVNVEGIIILLEKTVDSEKQLVLTAGSGLIDIDKQMHRATILHDRLMEEINKGKEALLDSEVDSPFKYSWPDDVRNIIVVPLWGKGRDRDHLTQGAQDNNCVIGMMVAVNIVDKPDFDSTDVKLFNSVANSCAVFVENSRLFGDIKELFIGSLRALTGSIDAKDRYTHGHSERVAFISRWIAERISEEEPLEKEQIYKIYLAGLLHDIGKIGIDETVLRKTGKLTAQEFDRIRKHPSIGAGILSGIKQMRDIVPGVLYHHERVNGSGYPEGLIGDQIPLISRIVGLADSFDAMTSERTYREAMTVEGALLEIKKGLDIQFDEEIGKVFINSDIYQLWDIIQDGFAEISGNGNSVEYGAIAVGALIR